MLQDEYGWTADPQFPPLLNGIKVKGHPRPFDCAHRDAKNKKAQSGDFYWSPSQRFLECALVLEPETHTTRCLHMLFTAMVAFGDAFGSLAPPELGVFFRWPNLFILNDAIIGSARIAMPGQVSDEDVPDWLVVGIKIELKGKENDLNPGEDMGHTNLFEEGVADLTQRDLLESFSRHFLVWIHTWNDEGFKPVHTHWCGRAEGFDKEIVIEQGEKSYAGKFLSLDDNGDLLLKTSGGDMVFLGVRDFVNSQVRDK